MQNTSGMQTTEDLFRDTIQLALLTRRELLRNPQSRARDLAVGIINEGCNLDWRLVYNPNVNRTPHSLCGSVFLAVIAGMPESKTLDDASGMLIDTMEQILGSANVPHKHKIHPVLVQYEKSWEKGTAPHF